MTGSASSTTAATPCQNRTGWRSINGGWARA